MTTILDLMARQDGDRVIGTLMSPSWLLAKPRKGPNLTRVIATIPIDGHEVLVTAMGGLFVRPPSTLSDPHAGDPFGPDQEDKVTFGIRAAEMFNMVLCELALRYDIVSLPAVPRDIAYGRLVDGHALIHASVSPLPTRTLDPFIALANGATWGAYGEAPQNAINSVVALEWARTLATVSPTLPRFALAAYASAELHEFPEALLMGWIVIEQLMDEKWGSYVNTLDPKARRERLRDFRTYTAAVRAEVLLIAGELPRDLYDQVQLARVHRNNLAHRARVTNVEAIAVLDAMVAVLRARLGARVRSPDIANSTAW